MSVKPEPVLEQLAAAVVDGLEDWRLTLVGDLRGLASSGGAARALSSQMQSVATRAALLSGRLSTQLLRGADRHAVPGVAAELEALAVTARQGEDARDVVAYFLKYRFLEFTGLEPAVESRMHGSVVRRAWTIPPQLESLDEAPDGDSEDALVDAGALIAQRLTAAPWLGGLRDRDIGLVARWLVALGFLEVALDTAIPAAGRPDEGVPVLRVRSDFGAQVPQAQDRLMDIRRATQGAETARRALLADLGTGLQAVGGFETYRLIADASRNDVIRISTYHLRTVIGSRSITDWLEDKENLTLRILCLGPTEIDGLTEGADITSLQMSLAEGIHSFRASTRAPRGRQRNRVQIRVYGDIESEAYFRGAILSGAGSASATPKRVIATTWPYAQARANYGECLRLDGDSSLSRLLMAYFDRTWENSIPLPYFEPFRLLRWVVRSVGVEVSAALAVAIALVVIIVVVPSSESNAVFELLGVLPLIVAAVYRVAHRAGRAIRLSIAVNRGLKQARQRPSGKIRT